MQKIVPNWCTVIFCLCLPVIYPAYLAYNVVDRFTKYTRDELAAARYRHKARRATQKPRVSKPLLPAVDEEGTQQLTSYAAAAATSTTTTPPTGAAEATTTTTTTTTTERSERKPKSFLSLPWELRIRIYDLALHNPHDWRRTVGEPLIIQIGGCPRTGPLPPRWGPGQRVRSDADPPSPQLEHVLRAGGAGLRQQILLERGRMLLREHRLLLSSSGYDESDPAGGSGRRPASEISWWRSGGFGYFPSAALAAERRATAVLSWHIFEAMHLEAQAEAEEEARREGRAPAVVADLMRAAKAVYADMLEVAYGRNTFSFFGAEVLGFWLATASPDGVRRVRYAHLALHVSSAAGPEGEEGSRAGRKRLEQERRKSLKEKKKVADAVARLRAELPSLKQLDVEVAVTGGRQPEDPEEFWRWLTGAEVLGRLRGMGLDAFILKINVLLDYEEGEKKRLPRHATKSIPLSSWDEEEYQALKNAVMATEPPEVAG